ncbi:hypothetical protein B9Z55_006884 [Caenorhabditis nigoni]|uniref:Uncharacterized protein n=1 Tax=Caenorhabditis nigoni TaxID=1611254 RepID=A0A2G5V761_9PELO|nr:hypothetical protein B9Z55_006884 [Caenorhabditis nigoni]
MHGSKSDYGFRRPTFSFGRPTEFLGTIREETRENARLIEDGGSRCSPDKKMTKSGGKIPKKSATFHGLQDLRKCSEF